MPKLFFKKNGEDKAADSGSSLSVKDRLASGLGHIRGKIGGIFRYKISFSITEREPKAVDADAVNVLTQEAPAAAESGADAILPDSGENIADAAEIIEKAEESSLSISTQPVAEEEKPLQAAVAATTVAPSASGAEAQPSRKRESPFKKAKAPKLPKDETGAESKDAEDQKEKKAQKVKKEKQPREKKPKEKPVKNIKKTKPAENGDGQKKFPLLILAIVGAVVAVGGGVFAAFMLMGNSAPDYSKIFADAEALRSEEKYDLAQSGYNKIIGSEDEVDIRLVADSYLGLAETYIGMNILDTAITTLESGYERTEDPAIKERLGEITPKPPDTEETTPPEDVNEPVSWADPALEKMVRIALGIAEPTPVMTKDLENIKSLKIVGATHAAADQNINNYNSVNGYTVDDVFYSERGQIKSLDDLKHFKNLRKLVICYNHVGDMSGVAGLKELDTLGLYANDISDISAVSGLEKLKYLYLFCNNISDISPLKNLSNLSQLFAQHNNISDLSPLSGLGSLTQIYLGNNAVTDISALAGHKSLRVLYADNNLITDISTVASIPTLTDVSFKNNPVKDMSPASAVQNVNKDVGNVLL